MPRPAGSANVSPWIVGYLAGVVSAANAHEHQLDPPVRYFKSRKLGGTAVNAYFDEFNISKGVKDTVVAFITEHCTERQIEGIMERLPDPTKATKAEVKAFFENLGNNLGQNAHDETDTYHAKVKAWVD
eukprot:gene2166-4717_t